jgi:hypothetical protein
MQTDMGGSRIETRSHTCWNTSQNRGCRGFHDVTQYVGSVIYIYIYIYIYSKRLNWYRSVSWLYWTTHVSIIYNHKYSALYYWICNQNGYICRLVISVSKNSTFTLHQKHILKFITYLRKKATKAQYIPNTINIHIHSKEMTYIYTPNPHHYL